MQLLHMHAHRYDLVQRLRAAKNGRPQPIGVTLLDANYPLSGFPSRPGSRLQHCGSPNTDRKVQALLADQMQLLDLVQTLIADHRTSLLEQQRLQQQLAATQEALNCERLDKDRAAALAQVR